MVLENIFYSLVNTNFFLYGGINYGKSTLQETALKVRLHAKFWSGIKADKVLRGDLAENVNARENYLHVSKHLLGRNCNKYFRRILDKIRHEHYYPMTVPFLDNSTDDYTGKVVSGVEIMSLAKAR